MLSSPLVIETLNQHYVSSWVLFQDLIKALRITSGAKPGSKYIEDVRAQARRRLDTGTEFERFCAKLLAGYTYPVDTHVFGRNGQFVGNTYAGDIFSDPEIFDKFEALLAKGAAR